jgi:hypothetical protein
MGSGASSALITALSSEEESTATSANGEGKRLHLYQGSTHQFIADATQARLANQLSDRFFDEFRYRPAPSEVTSWRNSRGAMASGLEPGHRRFRRDRRAQRPQVNPCGREPPRRELRGGSSRRALQ